MSMYDFDLIVIGGGPAGYPAAIRASQYNLKTAVVEKEPVFGGTCLNWGCIPTKAYYESSHLLSKIREAHKFGLQKIEDHGFLLKDIKERKDRIVRSITKGVEFLLKKNNLHIYRGTAGFIDKNTINISTDKSENLKLTSKYFLIASGSRPSVPKAFDTGCPDIITSNELLELEELPEELAVIGAGAIGLEFASIFNVFGSKITIIEMLPNLAPAEDSEISEYLEGMFKRKRIKAHTSTLVEKIEKSGEKLKITAKTSKDENIHILADKVLISTGRIPNTDSLNLESVSIHTDKGTIPVNEYGQTCTDNIYAAGDVLNTPQLAHVGTSEGLRAVEHITGKRQTINYNAIPSFIYSIPEISHSGLTERELSSLGITYQKAVFPLKAVAKSQIMGETDGFVKLLFSADGKVLGFHMIGALSPELSFEPTLAISKGLTISDLSNTIHAHPTVGEAIMEAAHLAEGIPIHILKP